VQIALQCSPTAHFVSVSTAILFRGAELSGVWMHLGAMSLIGAVFFVAALGRFRRTLALAQR